MSIAVSFLAECALNPDWGLLERVDAGLVLLEDLLGGKEHLAELTGVPGVGDILEK